VLLVRGAVRLVNRHRYHGSSAPRRRSGRYRHPYRDAVSATRVVSSNHASRPAIRPARRAADRAVHSRWMAAVFGWSRGNARISARRLNVEWSDMARLRPSSDGSDQSLGLTQCQAEHGPQRQGGRYRQARVTRLPATGGPRLSAPGRDRGLGEPDRQAPRPRRPASYAALFVTRWRCFGIW
jgi:hypothetical protein